MLKFFNSARIIAIGRLALALSLLVLTTTDPGNIGFTTEADDIIALSYTVFALIIVAIAWQDWWVDHIRRPVYLAVDIAIFILLPSLVEPGLSGYRVAGLTAGTYIILSVALRWDWRLASVTALALNLFNWILSTFDPVSPLLGSKSMIPTREHFEYIRNIYYFILISLLIVWVGSRISAPRAKRFSPTHASMSTAALIDALDYGLAMSEGTCGAIYWRDDGRDTFALVSINDGGRIESRILQPSEMAAADVPAYLFDSKRNIALLLDTDGNVETGRPSELGDATMQAIDAGPAFSVPLSGASGRGRLLVYGTKVPSIDLLKLLATAGEEITVAFDRLQATVNARSEAITNLREALARDLHDSVAQTLAGTRFWLRGLHKFTGQAAGLEAELNKIDTVLDAELSHVREVIGRLRLAETPDTQAEQECCQGMFETLAEQWRIEIVPTEMVSTDELAPGMEFELRQLIREAVSNSVRHGGATRVEIALRVGAGSVNLRVLDNGSGIPEGAVPGMISQRTAELGGKLETGSEAGGAMISVTLPLKGSA